MIIATACFLLVILCSCTSPEKIEYYSQKENYAKHFLDIGAGAIYGFDYCWWPNGASAYSFTIGTSYGSYGGYDYYWCLG